MGKPMIMVSSITYAMKGRDILYTHGIPSYIERMPRTAETPGCGYMLYVPKRTDEAERILRNAGVKVIGREKRADER